MADDLLASPEVLARRLGRDPADPAVIDALSAASAAFRGAARTHVSAVNGDTAVLDGDGSRVLMLPNAPVRAVHTVTVQGEAVTDWSWAVDGRLHRACGWPNEYRAVEVLYDHGYTGVPPEVQAVVTDRAAADVVVGAPGVKQMTVGGESLTFADSGYSTPAWERVVDHYRVGRADRP